MHTFIAISLFVTCVIYSVESESPILIISNDGPSVLGADVTFNAVLLNYKPKHELNFVFDDGQLKSNISSKSSNVSLIRNFSSDQYTASTHFMNVTVSSSVLLWHETIAANFSKFDLRRELVGSISVYRSNNISYSLDVDEVAVGENVTLVINLHDPSNYLKDADIDYSWNIDFERDPAESKTLVHNFTEPGTKHIKAIAVAAMPNNNILFGSYDRTITAKVPVNSVNVTGNPFLYHGDKLNLNITCNGTPPFVYCYKILKQNISRENFSCSDTSTFTSCHMEILKYIQDDGLYNVGIYISNDVHEIKRVLEVMVYSVAVKPNLSTVIIPLVCSLLVLGIIAGGIAYCVQQRNQMAVEVANFDFQNESDSYTDRTFFENIFDQLMCRKCTFRRLSIQSEADPLI